MQVQQSRTRGIGPVKLARPTEMRSSAPKTPPIQRRRREESKPLGDPIEADRRGIIERHCICRNAASRNSAVESIPENRHHNDEALGMMHATRNAAILNKHRIELVASFRT